MTGEIAQYDELFVTADGTEYPFMFPRPLTGGLGNVSVSPFAPKSTTGDRSYADYDAISAIAFTDFSGGIGQERMTDVTKYYEGTNLDTRGGQLTLGPLVTATTRVTAQAGDVFYAIGGSGNPTKIAARFTMLSSATAPKLRGVWVFLKGDLAVPASTVKLYANTANAPGAELGTATIATGTLRGTGRWVNVLFATPVTVQNNVDYWLSVENASATLAVFWLGAQLDVYMTLPSATWNGAAWVASAVKYSYLLADYQVGFDAPPKPLLGTGGDNVPRVWAPAGRSLYYIGAAAAPIGIVNGNLPALPAAQVRTPVTLSADIITACWYRAPSQTANFLYLGLGDGAVGQRFNGSIGAESWIALDTATVGKNVYASALCVHDALLFYAYDQNKIDCYDGTN
ncbi:MAG: hypothetical protein WC718_15910, partial [Phycisphaerales bacterium]